MNNRILVIALMALPFSTSFCSQREDSRRSVRIPSTARVALSCALGNIYKHPYLIALPAMGAFSYYTTGENWWFKAGVLTMVGAPVLKSTAMAVLSNWNLSPNTYGVRSNDNAAKESFGSKVKGTVLQVVEHHPLLVGSLFYWPRFYGLLNTMSNRSHIKAEFLMSSPFSRNAMHMNVKSHDYHLHADGTIIGVAALLAKGAGWYMLHNNPIYKPIDNLRLTIRKK